MPHTLLVVSGHLAERPDRYSSGQLATRGTLTQSADDVIRGFDGWLGHGLQRGRDIDGVVAEGTLQQIFEAGAGGGGLTLPDWMSLVLARGEGWTCATR